MGTIPEYRPSEEGTSRWAIIVGLLVVVAALYLSHRYLWRWLVWSHIDAYMQEHGCTCGAPK